MSLLNWDDKYRLNIREVDEQHKKLFGLLNEMYDAMQAGLGKEVVGNVLTRLVDYTVYHFAFEERLFRVHGYAEEAAHRAEHANLTEQAKQLKRKFDAGQTHVSLDTFKFLKDWLNGHILGTDKKYVSFFISKGLS